MSYDYQYDAPLSGPERARIEALKLAAVHMHDSAEEWVEEARTLSQFIVGERPAERERQAQIDAAFLLAQSLLDQGVKAVVDGGQGNPLEDPDGEILVSVFKMCDLVSKLSGLSEVPF